MPVLLPGRVEVAASVARSRRLTQMLAKGPNIVGGRKNEAEQRRGKSTPVVTDCLHDREQNDERVTVNINSNYVSRRSSHISIDIGV
jgi:hypothetical protein